MKKLRFKQWENLFQGFMEQKAIKADSTQDQNWKSDMKWNISSSLLEQYLEIPWA